MNKDYLRAMAIAENALIQLKGIYGRSEVKSFEDGKAYMALEKVLEDMGDFIRDIEHYSKETEQGYLQLNSSSRYMLNDVELTCGYPLEIYNTKYGVWEDGRIEHSSKYGGYYFYNYDEENIPLNEGIKARIRI
ncbi:DUF5348 domain-containing protein [Clostridium kluyveri]|uniref:DUF5348 domain-containing protein n=1 Tax=Clostridium kluyveri TaxID=1534 RepID=A0A1L5F2S2_CLOKL|nr:DUF5348 domain-containing protein [Clostridium kluyveri]APM37305.1 hypothetical protein BS101_00260 [Clostridium kluyveri]